MREKARLFRSMLLEPLECRSVFSADGIDVWHFSFDSTNFEFNRFQPAQYPRSGMTDSNGAPQNRDGEHSSEIYAVIFTGRWSPRGHTHRHGRFNEDSMPPLPAPEGEAGGRPSVGNPSSADTGVSKDIRLPTGDSGSAQSQGSAPRPTVSVDKAANSNPFSQPFKPTVILRFTIDSNNSNRGNNPPSSLPGNTGGNSSADRIAPFASQNSPALTSLASTSNTAALVNQVNSNQTLGTTGTVTFDFSSRLGMTSERASTPSLRSQRIDDFHFSKPQIISADSNVDKALVEAASVESLENLLSGLAESHRRRRMQNEIDADQADAKNESNWRSKQNAASVEIAIAGDGMISLALNRDIALNDLEDISEDARSENKAWIANVGIYRAFEQGAVAATVYAGLTNRNTRNSEASSTSAELTEVDGEVANSQVHPLLASTSAALGAVMLGLRRIRKFSPLMYTKLKR